MRVAHVGDRLTWTVACSYSWILRMMLTPASAEEHHLGSPWVELDQEYRRERWLMQPKKLASKPSGVFALAHDLELRTGSFGQKEGDQMELPAVTVVEAWRSRGGWAPLGTRKFLLLAFLG